MLIEWPTERRLCCHSAGSMTWDTAGNLYFAVGDNTNSGGDSAGMAPIDERTDRDAQYDAQRTSGNTNDLRGKINRIHPESNGTYTIPAGNLFAPGTAQHPARDLHHGQPQPVPDLGRQDGQQHPLLGRGRPGRRRHGRQPRPGRLRRVQPRHRARQLRLAVLRRPERRLQRLGLRGQRAARLVPVRRHRPARSTTRPATPACSSFRRPSRRWSGSSTAAAASGRRWTTRAAAARPTTPRSTTTTRTWSRT